MKWEVRVYVKPLGWLPLEEKFVTEDTAHDTAQSLIRRNAEHLEMLELAGQIYLHPLEVRATKVVALDLPDEEDEEDRDDDDTEEGTIGAPAPEGK